MNITERAYKSELGIEGIEPNYIFRFYEAIKVFNMAGSLDADEKMTYIGTGIMVLIIAILILKLPLYIITILIISWAIMMIYFMIKDRHVYTKSYAELHFYDDMIVMYQPKRIYDALLVERVYTVVKYNDIEECVIDKRDKTVSIHGVGRRAYTKYEKNGTSQKLPVITTSYKGKATITFNTQFEVDVDFEALISEYCAIEVTVKH